MKAFLLYRDQDIDLDRELPPNERALTHDLELEALWRAMAAGDEFLFDVARRVVFASVTDSDAIVYRQQFHGQGRLPSVCPGAISGGSALRASPIA